MTHPAPAQRIDPLDLAGLDDLLTPEEKSNRDAVRHFCDEKITAHIGEWFEAEYPVIRHMNNLESG